MKVRVLMFGWEFPPFNSGGLGVACLGLTRGLADLGAEVLFVMPKKLDVRVPWARFLFADETQVSIHAFNSPLRAYMTTSSYIREDGTAVVYGENLFAEVLRYGAFGAEIAKKERFDIIYA